MFKQNKMSVISVAILSTMISTTGFAADKQVSDKQAKAIDYDISFELEAGSVYDSHLSVEEIDRNSENGDGALYYQGAIKGDVKPIETLSLSASYQYSNKAYQDFDSFDQTIGLLNVDANYQFDWLTLGANVIDVDADLSGDPFLSLSQQGLYISKLVDHRYFFRLAKNTAKKTFEQLVDRNASVDELVGGVFVFFDQAQQFIHIGYTDKYENAVNDEFDYDSQKIALKYSKKFKFFSQTGQWKLGLRHTTKNYRNSSSMFDEPRKDKRNVADIEVELGVMENLSMITKLEFLNNQSNVESQDYQSEQVELLVKAHF